MIWHINLKCPYCDKCSLAYDTEKGDIVVNPDTGVQEFCDHVCYVYFHSVPLVVDDSWLDPVFPNHEEVLVFFLEEVHCPRELTRLKTPTRVDEEQIHFRNGVRQELWEFDIDDDESSDEDEASSVEGADRSIAPAGFGPSADKARRLLDAGTTGAAQEMPKVPQDLVLRACVLWSLSPAELAAELQPLWRQWGLDAL